MKLSRKMILSVVFIVLLTTSGIVIWMQSMNKFKLTMNAVGQGTVSASPSQANYDYGSVVQITAKPSAGWVLNGWSGDASGTASSISVTMNGDKAVTANFTKMEVVILETTMGNIEIELDHVHAPITVANFLSYVKTDFYDGTLFHRVYANFVIQGGGYTSDGVEKTTSNPIKLESNNGLKNLVGTIAMARTDLPNSATSQFFINLVDNTFLDYASSSKPGYAVFGKVVSGIDVVNKIASVEVETRASIFEKWPIEDIIINKAYLKP